MKQETSKCSSCEQTIRKLKVIESDYQFQLKKLAEDKSTQKALYQISIQKELRKMSEKYAKQKENHDDDNKKWIEKHDSTQKEYQHIIETLQKQTRSKVSKIEQESARRIDQFKQKKELECQNRIRQAQEKKKKEINSIGQANQKRVKQMKEQYERAVNSLKKNHELELGKRIRDFQSLISGISSQKRTEENMHQQTKKSHEAKIAALYQQIYNQKKQVTRIEAQTCQQQKKICQLKATIMNMQQQMEEMKRNHTEQINYLTSSNQNLLDNQRHRYKESIERIYRESKAHCEKYNQTLKNIEEIRVNENKIYQQNMQEIQQSVEERPSRLEDLQQIAELKSLLSKKQKQISLLMQELKWYRLQLQNKEETYNRIFVSQQYPTNENGGGSFAVKKKQFKLRRAGKSVTTVRQILNTMASGEQKKTTLQPVNQNLKNIKIL